jgi:hypothetical protein
MDREATDRDCPAFPITWRVRPALVMSTNPFLFELRDNHLWFYFMSEDNESTICILDALRE